MLFGRFIRIIKANLVAKDPADAQPAGSQYTHSGSYSHSRQQNKSQATTGYIMQEKAYYDALEVKAGASFTEIKAAYKMLVKKYHPDLFHNDSQKRSYAETVTQKINEAYDYFEKQHNK